MLMAPVFTSQTVKHHIKSKIRFSESIDIEIDAILPHPLYLVKEKMYCVRKQP